jgi:hypothetical protein
VIVLAGVSNVSAGGSSALRETVSRIPAYANYWWYDIDNNSYGPMMERASKMLLALTPEERRATAILWSQGQQDAVAFPDTGYSVATFTARYITAVLRILYVLRKRINSANPWSIPVYIETLGWRDLPEQYVGDEHVRAAQVQLVETYGKKQNLILGPITSPYLPLLDSVHPSPEGDTIRGHELAKIIPVT